MAAAERVVRLSLPPGAWQTYRRLLAYVGPHRRMFALGVLGAVVFAGAQGAFAYFAKQFGDGFEQRDLDVLVWLPVGLVGLFAVRGLADFTQVYCMGHVGRNIIKTLRAQVFE